MPTGEPSNSSVDCGTGNNSSYRSTIILEGTLAGAGVLVCAASIVVATRLRLYRQMVYRLAVYQVASALAFGITALLDVVQYLVMEQSTGHRPYQPLCLGNAYLSTYTLLVKLSFVVFITVHLFAFAVCYKNFKRLEACYVLISVLVPALMAAIPFATRSYGQQGETPWCWIMEKSVCPPEIKVAGIVVAFVLWYVPALVSLGTTSSLIVVMLSVLAYRAMKGDRGATLHIVATKQMLPLVVYPATFCVLLVPPMAHFSYDASSGGQLHDHALSIVDHVCSTGLVWSAGVLFLLHIAVVLRSKEELARQGLISANKAESSKLLTKSEGDISSRVLLLN